MNRELAKNIADAVLYEGYMLYPYRPSALKNRQRWTFGILYPPAYHEVQRGTERSGMHTECLLQAGEGMSVRLELRFLHLLARQVHQSIGDAFQPVSSILVDEDRIESWDEAVERSIELEIAIGSASRTADFSFPGSTNNEPLHDKRGQFVGMISRTQNELRGTISASAERICDAAWKLTVEVSNTTLSHADGLDRSAALLNSLLSAHLILTVIGGEFLSLLDPPADLRDAASGCVNLGNFPVLLGDIGEKDMLLCSPIVLYDYPQIAPESAGDFYDATEIDEMLTLRVMTLTDDEKNEMRHADDRARDLLQRTQQSAREQLRRTHGAIRGLRPTAGHQ